MVAAVEAVSGLLEETKWEARAAVAAPRRRLIERPIVAQLERKSQ